MEAEQKPRISIENDRPMSILGKPVLILDADKVNLKKVEEFYNFFFKIHPQNINAQNNLYLLKHYLWGRKKRKKLRAREVAREVARDQARGFTAI